MKIDKFKIDINNLITTDGYLDFCRRNNICYIKTDYFYIGKFNWRGVLHPEKIDNICVIGHSDYPVNEEISSKFKKVFCINKNSNYENTFGLPLGLTNDCDDSPMHKIYGNKEILIQTISESIDKDSLLYMNFNPLTFINERNYIWEKFSKNDWTKTGTIENTINGRLRYLREIKSSKFVLCPRGNGIDTHRLWETLYMGSIPIVKYEKTHHLLTDLPILFINDWSEVNYDFLNDKFDEIMNKEWNFEKLKISYWENFILKNIRNNE